MPTYPTLDKVLQLTGSADCIVSCFTAEGEVIQEERSVVSSQGGLDYLVGLTYVRGNSELVARGSEQEIVRVKIDLALTPAKARRRR